MRRVAVLLLVALLPASARAQEPSPPPEPFAGIQAMLDRRAEAMLASDEAAFMATIDRADPAFVRRQRLLFDGFQRIGLAAYRLEVTDRYWPELTTDLEVSEYGAAADPTVLHVEERYRLRGFDPQPALDDLFLTFVRRGGEWLMASDTDLSDLTVYTARKLWEFGPIETQRSEHFLYVSHPDLRSAGGAILASAEQALDIVIEAWPLPWSRRVVLLAPSTTGELRRIIQATFDLDVFVAFAYSSLDRAVDYDLTGHRVIFNWPNFSRYTEETQQSILAHELLHVATREDTGPMVPTFVEEGIADWVGGSGLSSLIGRVDAGDFDRRLPRDHEFITGSSEDILLSYDESLAAATYAEQRYGIRAVARMYRLLGDVRLAVGTPVHHVHRAMRSALGTGLERFESGWADWVMESL